jgi:protein TonB
VYAPPPRKERISAGVASFGAMALVGWVLISGLSVSQMAQIVAPLVSVDLAPPPRPKPTEPPRERPKPVQKSAPKEKAAARNLRNEATQVVAPVIPPIKLPPPLIAAPKPGKGSAMNNGASNQVGAGEGAAVFGNGRGGGGDGGDGDLPPMHTGGKLRPADLPKDLVAEHRDAEVGVRYYVGVDGRVSGCTVTRTSGSQQVDTLTCRLIEERFRFRPSLDGNGHPVRSIIVETHSWEYDRRAEERQRE